MRLRLTRVSLLTATWLAGCECASTDVVALGSGDATSTSGESPPASSSSSTDQTGDSTTGEPFDASRWIGRYHFENTFLPFGERGDPLGTYSLVNFEILPDGRASMFYDDCSFDLPITIAYEWRPSEEEGWLSLHPGEGETSLRYLALENLESLRVQLVEPCRGLQFEYNGKLYHSFTVVRPGESCWVDRCTTYHIMQVDYCEGEEPPPCP